MNTRSKNKWLAVLVAGLLAFPLLVSSCDIAPTPSTLEGYWLSGGAYPDGFEVTGKQFIQYADASHTISFAGTIENDQDLNDESGILIVKITDDGVWGSMTVGAYYGIAWKNLSDSGVSESYAYKGPSTNPKNYGVASLAEAQAEYTVANDYFGMYGDYERQ